ncbi:hypothetical protein D5086_009065, partial [Populus alba]
NLATMLELEQSGISELPAEQESIAKFTLDSLIRPLWQFTSSMFLVYALRLQVFVKAAKRCLGQHCFKFLSNYIWVYSGYGPLKTGIRREIDEALRPGVYALIDSCSADDLQYLHSQFGEMVGGKLMSLKCEDFPMEFPSSSSLSKFSLSFLPEIFEFYNG